MYTVKRYDRRLGTYRSININHTREEYFAWLRSCSGGNILALGANLSKFLPNTNNDQRSFILTGKFRDE